MRVLHINAVYGVGSTGVIMEDIHKLSMENGIESYVAYSTTRKKADEITNGYVIGKVLGKKLHAVLCRINGKQAYFSSIATKKLLKHLDKIKPDIVHLHNLHSNYINLNMLLKYLAKNNISVVITLHDCWFYTGGCIHYTFAECDGWQNACGKCPSKRTELPRTLFKASSSIMLSDRKEYFGKIKDLTVVGVSEWITTEATRTFLNGRRALAIHNGIDTEFFVPTESDLRKELGINNKFVVLGMSNKWLDPVNKEALEYFSQNLPDDATMLIVGCSQSQIEKLPPKVKGVGYVYDRDKLRKIYSLADVFANCTREESLSLVNVESQSCGTPAVTYRNTGAKETVDNIHSFSVETENYKDLFLKVMEIKENGKAMYSEGCRDFIKVKFKREENYKKYIELYKDIFSRKS